jgi:hypothetical protein
MPAAPLSVWVRLRCQGDGVQGSPFWGLLIELRQTLEVSPLLITAEISSGKDEGKTTGHQDWKPEE